MKITCPKCGSEKIKRKHYWDYNKDGKKIRIDECQDCGHVFENSEVKDAEDKS